MVLKECKKGIGFRYALEGLKTIYKHERNFKIHLIALLLVIILSFLLKLNYIEWAIVILISSLVLSLEIINSTIELIIDYLKSDIHQTAKKIKYMAASEVLIVCITASINGIIIFGLYYWATLY